MAEVRLQHSETGVVVTVHEDHAATLGAFKPYGEEAPRTVAELTAEIKRRNDGRAAADRISLEGNKADLLMALQSDDEGS